LAIWGLAASGELVHDEALTWLKDQQKADGGWAFAEGDLWTSDSNSTALVVQTLIAGGVDASDPAIVRAIAYLADVQTEDGGWGWDSSSSTADGDSTAVATQALLAADIDPMAGWDWAQMLTASDQITLTVRKPMDALFALQTDAGAFQWLPGTGDNSPGRVQPWLRLRRR